MSELWTSWDLNKWLSELENRHKDPIQLGLNRIREVAQNLNLLRPASKVITVAGTNGKGSTVSALEKIYHTAGYKVGAYTSPHLIKYNERIRVNLELITDSDLCDAFRVIEEGRGPIVLTYFETTTLAALWYFQKQAVDVMILEVGLGGRLDATNIIDPDLAIISTIDYDHQEFLGDTLEAIGYEKAGILREGTPLIYADSNPPVSILEQAKKLKVPCYLYERDFSYLQHEDCWDFNGLGLCIKNLSNPKIQLKSASAALVAVTLMQPDLPLNQQHIFDAIKSVYVAGRLQFVPDTISVLYDVSHNPQSARLLADTLRTFKNKGKIHAVFSALQDKDIFGLIMPLRDCVDHWYPAQLECERAANADTLLSRLKEAQISADLCYTSPLVAFETALNQAEDGDLIVVYGSFFTVSHVMSAQLELKEIQ